MRTLLEAWCVSTPPLTGQKKQEGKLGANKLFDRIVQLVIIANETGLVLPRDGSDIWARYEEKNGEIKDGEFLRSTMSFFFILYKIRIAAAQRGAHTDEILSLPGITDSSVAAGWGEQLDCVYDRLAKALEGTAEVLRQCLRHARNTI